VDKNAVYNRQHYSTYRMNQDKTDVEDYIKKILADWMPESAEKVMNSNYLVVTQQGASTSIDISSGYGYKNQDRVVVPEDLETAYTFTFPSSGDYRYDRVYLQYESVLDPDSATNVEFLKADGSVTTQTIYQRKMDYFKIGVSQGELNTPSSPTYPPFPVNALKLALIKLDNTLGTQTMDITDEREL
jgi:hypothetical protein